MAVSRIDEAGLNVTQYGNRNLVINGAMQVAQRGNLTGQTSETYFIDRFVYTGLDEGTWSLSQESDAPSGSGFTKSAKLEITTADSSIAASDYAQLRYKIENQDIKHLLKGTADAKTITLSFWVKSSLAQDFKFRIRENYSATTRQIIKSYTISSANTWQQVTMTFDGDTGGDDFSGSTDTDSNFILEWMLGGGSNFQGGTTSGDWEDFDQTKYDASDTFLTTVNSTFYLTGVQLEVGDTATPFEHRTYADELLRCQRYYAQGGIILSDSSPDRYHNTINLPCEMRAQPTVSSGGIDSGSGGTMVSTWDSSGSSTSKRNFYQGANNSVISNSWFAFDAEL